MVNSPYRYKAISRSKTTGRGAFPLYDTEWKLIVRVAHEDMPDGSTCWSCALPPESLELSAIE
jgi:hypothetical protein